MRPAGGPRRQDSSTLTEEVLSAAPPPRPTRRPRPTRFLKPLAWLSAAAGAAAAVTLVTPRIPLPDRFGSTIFELLWFDETWKQWSGYLLLAFSVLALLFGARKRIRRVARFGSYNWWRIAHVCFGIACVLLLFAHTGFRFGANLNAVLVSTYVAALILGTLSGLAIGRRTPPARDGARKAGEAALSHLDRLSPRRACRPAGSPRRAHHERVHVLKERCCLH